MPYVIHEALHMLNYERVYPEGTYASRWFEEGIANYFGFSRVDGRLRIDPGEIDKSSAFTVDTLRIQFDPRFELREHLKRLREGGPLPLRWLLDPSPGESLWEEELSSRAYGASWTLVHFLMHGEKGRHRKGFLEYAAREAEGAGGLEAFSGIFGPDLNALEAAWHAYEAGL